MKPLGFTPAGDAIGVDLDRLIGSHACIVANAGGGKSGLIRRLLEVTHGRVQHIVLDVEDEFYTLRERFSYVIAGGDGADAPATVAGAADLALAALRHNFSLIVQLNDLGPAAAPAFVGRFLEALIAAPRDLWRPLLVVLDEAHRFAPQEGSTEATHGVHALAAQGRKRGFTAILASQRIAKIDANVRGDVNNWLLGRVGQSLDRRTGADLLGFPPSSAEARGLQGMADRTFWGFGPAIAREPVQLRVADVETTPVRPGQAKIATPPAPEELQSILAGLARPEPGPEPHPDDRIPADPAEAFAAGSDVGAALKDRDDRIAELDRQLAELQVKLDDANDQANRYLARIYDAVCLLDPHGSLRKLLPQSAEAPDRPLSVPAASGGGEAKGEAKSRAPAPASPTSDGEQQSREWDGRGRRSLQALHRSPHGLTERQWAWIAGFSRKGGTWGTYKSSLRAAGLIEEHEGRWRTTRSADFEIGADVGDFPAIGAALATWWGKKLPGVGRMVAVLVRRWPHFTTRDGLAADLGMAAAGGTFTTYLSRLRSAGMLDEQGKRIRLHPELMEYTP
ncbi:MAG TPA: DUF87 domain-containing protein [Allosphingosinicella sp.]|jgi:hypothetical protein